MSEPIRSKAADISKAPTPQNTPSSVTNSYLRSQPPTVATITEETSQLNLANNPALLSMIEGKLGTLVGTLLGYVDRLPRAVKDRVYGLKSIQQQQMSLEAEFQRELLELEKRYFAKYEPLYARRRRIIVGDEEPSTEEIEEGKTLQEEEEEDEDEAVEGKLEEVAEEDEEDEDGEAKPKAAVEEDDEEEDGEPAKGIPGFWLTALENLQTVAETITDRDSEVLQFLDDVRMEYLKTPGFQLIFEFSPENTFFTNKVLTKTYHYQAELGYSGDFVYDHAEGCEIDWKSKEANVTINIERRKQRNRTTKQTRTIEKLTPTESFFNFFDPPKPPKVNDEAGDEEGKEIEEEEEEDEEEDGELEARLELDYQLGEEIKDRLIPRAIDWFTGDAVDYGFPEDFDDEDLEDEDEEDEDDDDDDDDDEEGRAEKPAECNQQ